MLKEHYIFKDKIVNESRLLDGTLPDYTPVKVDLYLYNNNDFAWQDLYLNISRNTPARNSIILCTVINKLDFPRQFS